MPEIDENEILRRLKLLSHIEPSCEATERAIDRVRLGFSWGTVTTTTTCRIKSPRPIIKFAAAAVLLISPDFSLAASGRHNQWTWNNCVRTWSNR